MYLDYINNEIIIKGDKDSLIYLSDYIRNTALSKNSIDHIHLDDLTIINSDSKIKSIIIEKDDRHE